MLSSKKDWFVFIIGCVSTFPINLIGRVYLGELLIFMIYPFIPWKMFLEDRRFRKIFFLGILWLIGALFSDIWRETPIIDMLKGSTSIVFLLSLLPFAYWALYDDINRWLTFFFGSVVSTQLAYYLVMGRTEYGNQEIWQVYAYNPLASAVAIYLYYKGRHILSYSVLLSFGVWILFNGSRNVFLCNSLAATLLILIDYHKAETIWEHIENYSSHLKTGMLVTFISLLIIDFSYETLASKGYLGEQAYNKYIKQTDNEIGLMSGRLEAVMDIDLISRSPIIGYGSYAKDKTDYVSSFYAEHHLESNRKIRDLDSVENMLPRHSRIFGLWMWHGFFAGVFWIYIIYLVARALRNGYMISNPGLTALFVLTCMTELWDTLFSIMSIRLPLLFFLAYLIFVEYYAEDVTEEEIYEEYELQES